MSADQSAERPVPLSPDQITTIAEFLPPGAAVIGGVVLSYEAKQAMPSDAPGDCVIVIYTLDDHTIHKVTMCEVRPLHYELTGDTVIGHW